MVVLVDTARVHPEVRYAVPSCLLSIKMDL